MLALRLPYRPPYDWPHLERFFSRRAIGGVESVAAGAYARTVRTASGHAFLQVKPVAGADALELKIQGGESADLPSLSSYVRRMFDLSADPASIAVALQRDPRLGALVTRHPGLRIPGTWDPFESGVRAIVGQQISVAAGRTLLTRLVKRAGERVAEDTQLLSHLFPTPTALAQSHLENLGCRARASLRCGASRVPWRMAPSPSTSRASASCARCCSCRGWVPGPQATWPCGVWGSRMGFRREI